LRYTVKALKRAAAALVALEKRGRKMNDNDALRKLARRAVLAVEQVFNLKDEIPNAPTNTARMVRIDVMAAIEMLQELEKLLSYRMNEE
jgi:hypothetical protein